MGRRGPDVAVYRNCSFVISLINSERLSYEAGSQLHLDHGELTAITAAGEQRRVPVREWQDVIINAADVLTNRWRRQQPPTPSPSGDSNSPHAG